MAIEALPQGLACCVLAYGVWAARDVLLRRRSHVSDLTERVMRLEQESEASTEAVQEVQRMRRDFERLKAGALSPASRARL